MRRYLYMFFLFLTSVLWGGNIVVSKLLVNYASATTLTNLRWMIVILFLLPIVWIKEKKIVPPRQAILPLFLMGVTGVVLCNIFSFWALEQTTATNAGLLSALIPVFIAIFSFLFSGERIHPVQVVAMLISFLGVIVVLCKGKVGLLLVQHFNSGDLWMLASFVMWSLYPVCGRWAMYYVSPVMSTLYSSIFGVLVLLPFSILNFEINHFTAYFLWLLLYVGVLATVVCMVFWNISVQKLGGTTAGMFQNLTPVFTMILAFLFLDERITWVQITGSIIVLAGCYLFSWYSSI
jgi:drug/metabolite transporter (DMT)-like permease